MAPAKKTPLAIFLCTALLAPLAAESPLLLSAEIQGLEKKLSSRLENAEKNRVWRELARLLELSGNMEGAARAWNEAAIAAQKGTADYDAFLRCAMCLAATGEFDNAAAAARTALLSGEEAVRMRALVVSAQIEAFRSGSAALLQSMVSQAAYAPFLPSILYTIWRVSGGLSFRARLLEEFPQSPEALAIKGDVGSAPTALWLFSAPGTEAGAVIAGGKAAALHEQAVQVHENAIAMPPAAVSSQNGFPTALQTGLFGAEENAQSLASRLRRAGFSPFVAKKVLNGKVFWAVGVPPGQDYNATILLLKNAGFEAFPVY